MYYAPAPYGVSGLTQDQYGFFSEKQFVELYSRRIRRNITNWNFYIAFSLFRNAGIAQGVYKRSLQGNASSPFAKNFEVAAQLFGDIAWNLVHQQNSKL